MRLTELRPSSLFDGRLARKDYLQISAFPDLVVVEREENPHALQRKATGRAAVSGERDGWLDATKPDS